MSEKETIVSGKAQIDAAISAGMTDLTAAASQERDAIVKYAGIADDFASKYAKDKKLTLEIRASDSPELAGLKRAMNTLEEQRLAAVAKTSQTISGVTAAAGAVAGAIYPPAGAAVMIVGSLVNMAYKFYNSAPAHNWVADAQGQWTNYAQVGLPAPHYYDGDNIQGYVQQRLQRAIGYGVGGFGMAPDEYQALFDSMSQPDFGNTAIATRGGLLHTARPDVFRGLYLQSLGLLRTRPPETIDTQNTMYQASPYLAYQYEKFGTMRVLGAGGGSSVPTWWWYQDCNLWLCSEGPVPLIVRDANDMDSFISTGQGASLPRIAKGVPFRQLLQGQMLMDTMISQACLTAAMSQGVPTWACKDVIDAGKNAWADYRREVLEVYYAVESQGGNGVTDPRISKVTGVTQEANINPNRRGDMRIVNRGPSAIDGLGLVYKAALQKAEQIAQSGLTVANAPTLRPAWVMYAKKANFQVASVIERNASRLVLSDAATMKMGLRKGAVASTVVVPENKGTYQMSDAPQYVPNTFAHGWSTGTKVAVGVGGTLVVGGLAYAGFRYFKGRKS